MPRFTLFVLSSFADSEQLESYSWKVLRRRVGAPTYVGPVSCTLGQLDVQFMSLRLMMRPARSASPDVLLEAGDDNNISAPSTSEFPLMVWSNDRNVDWLRARQILKDLRTDGRHISTWRQWLQPHRLSVMVEAGKEVLSIPPRPSSYCTSIGSCLARSRMCKSCSRGARMCMQFICVVVY